MQHELSKEPITLDQSVDYTRAWHFWQHAKNPLDLIVSGKAPKIWRETIEAVAADYVALPYRASQLERLIVDILIALELYAFGDEVIYEPTQLPWVMRWSQRRVPRKRIRELLKLMKDAYGELASGGMVSTRRLREVVTKAADAGVAWPSPLMAVLDDNISRTGRLEPVDQSWLVT